MDKYSQKILEAMCVDNGPYVRAMNADFRDLPLDVFVQIKQMIGDVLNIDKDWTLGKLRETRPRVNRGRSKVVSGESELTNWAKVLIRRILEEDAKAKRTELDEEKMMDEVAVNEKIHAELQKEIINNGRPIMRKMEWLAQFVAERSNYLDGRNMALIMCFFSGLNHVQTDPDLSYKDLFPEILQMMAFRIAETETPIEAEYLSSMLNGLGNLRKTLIPKGYLDAVTAKFKQVDPALPEFQMDRMQVVKAFWGLRNLDGSMVSGDVIKALTAQLISQGEGLNALDLRDLCSGLQGKNGLIPEELIDFICDSLERSQEKLHPSLYIKFFNFFKSFTQEKFPDRLLILVLEKLKDDPVVMDNELLLKIIYSIKHLQAAKIPAAVWELFKARVSTVEGSSLSYLERVVMVLNKMNQPIPQEPIELIVKKLGESGEKDSAKCCSIVHKLGSLGPESLPRGLVQVLTRKIDRFKDDTNCEDVSKCFAGLANLPAGHITSEFLDASTRFLTRMKKPLNGWALSDIFSALKNSDSSVVRKELIWILTTKLNQLTEPLKNMELSKVFLGIRYLDKKVLTREFFLAMARHLTTVEGDVDSECVSTVSVSLRNLDSSVVPKQFIAAFQQFVEKAGSIIDLGLWTDLIYTLHGLDERSVPKDFLRFLGQKIEQSTETGKIGNLTSALHGLQNLGDDVVPKSLLNAISGKIEKSSDEISGQNLSAGLYGLKNMSDVTVPRELLSAIAEKVRTSRVLFEWSYVTAALYGLQNLTFKSVPNELLEEIYTRLCESVDITNIQAVVDGLTGIQNLHHSGANKIRVKLMAILEENRDCWTGQDQDLMRLMQVLCLSQADIPDWLSRKYNETISKNTYDTPRYSDEKIAFSYLRGIYRGQVLVNFILDGWELDFYLPALNINIEIDGGQHETKKFRDRKRDNYLSKKGIRTIRIKTTDKNWQGNLSRTIKAISTN